MCKQILVTKEKGGGGATTTATNLGFDLADRGHSVLIVDMDTRGDAAPCLGLDPHPGLQAAIAAATLSVGSWAEVAATVGAIAPAVATQWDGLHLLATNTSSTLAALELTSDLGLGELADLLAGLGQGSYDFVIYDTSVGSGRLRQAAMMVADLMVIPTRVEALGMPDIAGLIEAYGRPLEVVVLPVCFRKTLGIHNYNLGLLAERYGDRMASPVPDRVAVIESHSAMMPVLAYAPENDASVAYRRFTDDVLAGLESPMIDGGESDDINPYLLTGDELDRAVAAAQGGR